LDIPYYILFPFIFLFCFLGVYSLNNNFWELLIMLIFGLLGYIFRKIGYEPGPFLLAMILGPMMETSYRQSMTISRGDPMIFLQRPFAAILLIIAFLVMTALIVLTALRKRRLAV